MTTIQPTQQTGQKPPMGGMGGGKAQTQQEVAALQAQAASLGVSIGAAPTGKDAKDKIQAWEDSANAKITAAENKQNKPGGNQASQALGFSTMTGIASTAPTSGTTLGIG